MGNKNLKKEMSKQTTLEEVIVENQKIILINKILKCEIEELKNAFHEQIEKRKHTELELKQVKEEYNAILQSKAYRYPRKIVDLWRHK